MNAKRRKKNIFFEILTKRKNDFVMKVKEYIESQGIVIKDSTNQWKCDFWIPRDSVIKLYGDFDMNSVISFLEETEGNFWIPVAIQYKTIRRKDTLTGNLPKIIIGRRYSLNSNTCIRHCFHRLVYTVNRSNRPNKQSRTRSKKNFDNIYYPFNSSIKRQLKMKIKDQLSITRVTDLLKECIFVDFETITDFQDNLSEFPVAQDTSMIFMIGAGRFDENNKWVFNLFTVDSLTHQEEKRIVQDFNKYLHENSKKYRYFVHWSPAEPVHLRKVLQRLPCIDLVKYHFFDLMKPFKKVYPEQSVSLKRIAKSWKKESLIQTNYSCANATIEDGLTAMASVISDWNAETLQQIAEYNHKDTLVMAEMLKLILS